jgi:hypothetical protein
MIQSRRSLLTAIGLSLPSGLVARAGRPDSPADQPLVLRLRPFEEAVREAFAGHEQVPRSDVAGSDEIRFRHRLEVGHSDLIRNGVQGTHNDRPFARVPARHLRIVRTAFEPGREIRGVRLYVATVDVVLTDGRPYGEPSRPLDFSTLPPAPTFVRVEARIEA